MKQLILMLVTAFLLAGSNLAQAYYDPAAGRFLSADPLGHAASMDLYSFSNGDPINNFDPDGRLSSKFSTNIEQGYGLGQSASMAFTGTLQDAAVSTGSPFLSYSAGLLNAASLTAGQLTSPQVTLPQAYQSNYNYFGNSYDATVATIDPAYMAEAGVVEAYGGQGIQAGNSGVTLSGSQRAFSAFEGVQGTVGTVGVGFGGAALTRLAGLTGPAAATETPMFMQPQMVQQAQAQARGSLSVLQSIVAPGRFDTTVNSLDEARILAAQAFPEGIELPPAVSGAPYPSPPQGVLTWYQVHPAEPGINELPHIKYADWSQGKKGTGGSWGHIFFNSNP